MPSAGTPELRAWYRRHGRDLPWRSTRDPWAILVSEVLLQQTRVETARPAFERLLRRFPDPGSLAGASEEEVLRAWAGLGYYRRARNLHAAAKELVAKHGGRVPADVPALAELPGLGPYTVAAVRAFAFDMPSAPLDANLLRVLARWSGDGGDVSAPATRARLAALAEELLRPAPREVASALMDLGSAVCTAAVARCDACPLAATCVARREGRQHELPRLRAKAPPTRERWVFARVLREGKVLLERRGPGLLEGFWALPGAPLGKGVLAREALEARLEELGVPASVGAPGARGRWVFSHRVWEFRVHAARAGGAGSPVAEARWVGPDEVAGLPVAQPHRPHLFPEGPAPRARRL